MDEFVDYLQMACDPIYEFILWDNCSNNCKFCFQAKSRSNLSIEEKQQSMFLVENKIKTINCKSNLLFVGGELFDDIALRNDLVDLFKFASKLLVQEKVGYVYFNTNLLYEDLSVLESVISIFNDLNLLDKIKFTTSYDECGRFETASRKMLFERNLVKIQNEFPNLKIVVNAILTRQMCEALLSEDCYLHRLASKCSFINLLPYVVCDKMLMPMKTQVFKSLISMDCNFPGYLEKYIKNMNLVQDRKIFKFKNGNLEFVSEENAECGHCLNFKKYSKDGSCFICDLNAVFGEDGLR